MRGYFDAEGSWHPMKVKSSSNGVIRGCARLLYPNVLPVEALGLGKLFSSRERIARCVRSERPLFLVG